MDPSAAEELTDVLKSIVTITGCVEKLVRGKWTDRWVTISVKSASIHYYLSKNDQENKKVRGIYPLMGASVQEETKGSNKNNYPFTVVLASNQKIRFRTNQKVVSHAWSMVISNLATRTLEKQARPIEGTLDVKSGVLWSRRQATLDTNSKNFTLGKSVRKSGGAVPVEIYSLAGAAIRPVKSYGKTFEFELSMTTASGKQVELRMRASKEEERVMWCQAVQAVINGERMFDLSPSRGQEEGSITVFETTEDKPGGGGGEVPVVILKGLQDFSQRISMKINHYLQPHHIIHAGEDSKVYHTNLKAVSIALTSAGFKFGCQTPEGWIFDMHAKQPLSLPAVTTITKIIDVVWPRQSSNSNHSTSSNNPYDSSLLPSSLVTRNIPSGTIDYSSQQEDRMSVVSSCETYHF